MTTTKTGETVPEVGDRCRILRDNPCAAPYERGQEVTFRGRMGTANSWEFDGGYVICRNDFEVIHPAPTSHGEPREGRFPPQKGDVWAWVKNGFGGGHGNYVFTGLRDSPTSWQARRERDTIPAYAFKDSDFTDGTLTFVRPAPAPVVQGEHVHVWEAVKGWFCSKCGSAAAVVGCRVRSEHHGRQGTCYSGRCEAHREDVTPAVVVGSAGTVTGVPPAKLDVPCPFCGSREYPCAHEAPSQPPAQPKARVRTDWGYDPNGYNREYEKRMAQLRNEEGVTCVLHWADVAASAVDKVEPERFVPEVDDWDLLPSATEFGSRKP